MAKDEHGIPPAGPAQAPAGLAPQPGDPRWKLAGKCLATAVIAVLFLALPGYLLYKNLANSAGAQALTSPSRTLSPPAGNSHFGTPGSIYLRRGAYLCVAVEFLGLDPANSWATFGIQVDVTRQGKAVIKKFEQGQQHQGGKKAKKPAPRFRNISLVLKSGNGLASLVIPIHSSTLAAARPSTCDTASPTLRGLGELDRNAAFRTTQHILVLGQPRAFPEDSYQASESVAMLAGRGTYGIALPSSLIIASQNQDLSLRVHLDDAAAGTRGANYPLIFTVRRPAQFFVYTYLIGLLPFVLLVGLMIYAYVRRKMDDINQVALAVAATVVAILPLRAVLVPASVPGLTRLDLLFGAGISLLVALTFAFVIIWPRHGQ
jgi:hypothetical protein